MKNSKPLIWFIFCALWLAVELPPLHSQTFCNSGPGPNAIGSLNSISDFSGANASGPYFLRIYVRVVRRSDGTGGQTPAQVDEALGYLDLDFNDHNIFFVWDCNIDYIDSDLYYNQIGTPDIFVENPHSDGIDIYLFWDQNPGEPDGHGRAAGYGSKAFYVFGNYWKAPFKSLSRSHLISHEMGHCLGLYHTHDFIPCRGLVNRSNALTCPNYVWDTPADPGMLFNTQYPSCEWTEIRTDINADQYDPDEKNIMAYTDPDCMAYFTEGQGERARRVISILPLLQACLVQYNYSAPVINNTTTWTTSNTPNNGNINIVGDLIIEAGATLTISKGVTVHFDVNSRLIIKPLGRLNLSGTLTGLGCGGYTWEGVEVWGQMPNSNIRPGIFNGRGGVVENAEVAAKLFGPSYQAAGGRIVCEGTVFKNNKQGVDFAPFENRISVGVTSVSQLFPYVGKLNNCQFITDQRFPHKASFEYFIQMNGVTGVNITGCEMLNTRPLKNGAGISEMGYGIKAIVFNVGAGLSSPVFHGLAYGVQAARIRTGGTFSVTNATFDRCFTGIRSLGVNNSTVLFNTFYMGNLTEGVPNEKQYGVSFEIDISGFTFEENGFIGEGGNVKETIGSACILHVARFCA